MMYFPELSPYRFGLHPTPWTADGPPEIRPRELFSWLWDHGGPPAPAFGVPELNIGWLDAAHSYVHGKSDENFKSILAQMCTETSYHLWRSTRPCALCGVALPGRLGKAEIRVAGAGVVYAAPNTIHHFVQQHEYLPPKDFIVSVLKSGGRQANTVAGTTRDIPEDLLTYVKVDVAMLQTRVNEQICDRHKSDEIRNFSIRAGDQFYRIDVAFIIQPADIQCQAKWEIPRNAVVSIEQGAYGIWTMLLDALNIKKEELLRPGKPPIFSRK